jgi:hypothetical protein
MKKRLIFILTTVVLSVTLTSCSQYTMGQKFDDISISMGKEEVLEKLGANGMARGSIINKYGQVIEVREYEVWRPCVGIETYWLFFCDGQLVKWGKAGDWAETQRNIYDINFNISHVGH